MNISKLYLMVAKIILLLINALFSNSINQKVEFSSLRTTFVASDTLYVQQYGAIANDGKEDSESFQKAINDASAKGKILFIPKGKYYIKDVLLKSNTKLIGEGEETILQKIFNGDFGLGSNFSYFYAKSDPKGEFNVKNLCVSGIHFRGTSDTDGFSDYKHLLNLNGVEEVLIKNCFFTAFNGDGLYLGSDVGVEKHNKNVLIQQNIFNGLNKQNRNGISVIDGDNISITNNSFFNTSRHNMPGAIDIEPDAFDYHVVRNITIEGNYFRNIGGNVGTISLVVHLPQQRLKRPVENITISRNNMMDVANGIAIFQKNKADEYTPQHNISIIENSVLNTSGYPLALYGVGSVTARRNVFDQFKTNIFIGLTTEKFQCYNIFFDKNNIKRNSGDGVGIALQMVKGFTSQRNIFEEIGMISTSFGVAILGETNGKSSHIKSIHDVVVGEKTTAFSLINPGHSTTVITNEFIPAATGKKFVSSFLFRK